MATWMLTHSWPDTVILTFNGIFLFIWRRFLVLFTYLIYYWFVYLCRHLLVPRHMLSPVTLSSRLRILCQIIQNLDWHFRSHTCACHLCLLWMGLSRFDLAVTHQWQWPNLSTAVCTTWNTVYKAALLQEFRWIERLESWGKINFIFCPFPLWDKTLQSTRSPISNASNKWFTMFVESSLIYKWKSHG